MNRKRIAVKQLAKMAAWALGLFITILAWNYWWFPSRQLSKTNPLAPIWLDSDAVILRLIEAIKIPSISTPMSRLTNDSQLYRFRDYLRESFPQLHVSPFIYRTGVDFGDEQIPSVLLEWPGQDPKLDAILLMSHFDVVPAESSSLSKWTHPPFSGQVDDKFVWGRGTLDCKHGVMAILEAISLLHAEGFKPERSIFVALGHDEELGGQDGNRKMAEWFRSNRIRLHTIIDEGGCVFTEFPGLAKPAALVGVAEKGFLTVELTATVSPEQVGHSSMPPRETAVSILAVAVDRLQSTPFPARIDGGLRDTLSFLGPEMPFARKLVMSNMWLFGPLVERSLSAKPSGDALLRTSQAATMIEGGISENVLPLTATAKVNLRLLPGDSIDSALEYLRGLIDDPRVAIEPTNKPREASPVSDIDSAAFRTLQTTIHQVMPDVVVAPFVLVGSTDTVHYTDLSENIFRFIPTRLTERDTQRFHGIDERIAKQDYFDIIRFFYQYTAKASLR
jgi:carboxypeptidase PM20D1